MTEQSLKEAQAAPAENVNRTGSPADMRETVGQLTLALKSALQGKPVKDADELILHAELALAASQEPIQDNLGNLSQTHKLPNIDRTARKPHNFSAGPWDWWTSNSVVRLSGADGKDGGVLYASGPSHMATIVVSKENARLIKAAPTLLAAVELAEDKLSSGGQSDAEVLRVLRAAIDEAL